MHFKQHTFQEETVEILGAHKKEREPGKFGTDGTGWR